MGEYYGLTVGALCKLVQSRGRDGVMEIIKLGGVEEICKKLGTSPTQGLGKASLEHRRATFGSNEIPRQHGATFFKQLWNVLCDRTLVILIVFCALALLFYYWIFFVYKVGCVVIIVFLVTVLVDYFYERRFQYLLDDVTVKSIVTVIRNAVATEIVVDDVVVGDVCIISNNDTVPADGILIQSNELKIDESSLFGTSSYVNKNLQLDPMVLRGTKVINGSGTMLAVAVGKKTHTGVISSLLTPKGTNVERLHDGCSQTTSFGEVKSILQQKIYRLFLNYIYICSGFTAIVFVTLLLQFVVKVFVIDQQSWKSHYVQRFIIFLFESLGVFIVALPESVPLTVTIVLAITITKLFRNNKLVRNLNSSETMGTCTSICFDKTGTLTQNCMDTVQSYVCGSQHTWNSENKLQVLPNNTFNLIAENISINSSAASTVTYGTDSSVEQTGNKTECALLGLVKKLGLNYQTIRDAYSTQIVHTFSFNSDRKLMGTVIRISDGGYRLFVKGASEIVLSKCKFLIGQNEKLMELTVDICDRIILEEITPTTSNRLRSLTLAYRDFVINNKTAVNETVMNGVPNWTDETNIVKNLTCLGVFAIEDPIRFEVPDLVKKLQSSGITVRMVTGDDINTAKSVATKCGIINADEHAALDAAEFNRRIRDPDGNIKQHLFDEVYPQLRVLARASPMDKYNLVNGIIESTNSKCREIVAMVGDGDSDALALKKADVGITFNELSSDVAKNASNIILIDNKIGGITNTVLWGRHAYDSIIKFVQFLLHVKLVSLVSVSFGLVGSNLRFDFYRADLFWNIMALVPIFFHDPVEELVQGKLYGRNENIISKNMIKNIVGQSMYHLVVLFAFILIGADFRGLDDDFVAHHSLFIYNIFVVISFFGVFNARSLHGERNIFYKIHSNFLLCTIWILLFVIHICAINLYPDADIEYFPMTLFQWGACLFFGVGILIWQQLLFFCNSKRRVTKNESSEVFV